VLSEDFPALAGFRVGSQVAGYRLEAQVGAGGFAVVFRARDERLGRLVALKILAPALAADEGFRRRFIAESRAAAAVDDPHIIPVHEAGEAGGVLFIAMRFVAGGDLRGVLGREGPLEPGRAAGFLSPVASALDAAHRAGLVHRDVKPANILVDASAGRPDHVYLSDFGVSKGAVSSVSLTGTGHFLGTPDYSAPEQIQGRAVDGRTDQYALACVAFQLLTGSVPFERDQGMAVLLAHLSEPPPPLAARRPGLPGAADQVLARAMAKAPEKRYGCCRDFADALREALGLAPYTSPGPAEAPGHPDTEIGSQPAFPGLVAARTGTAAGLADPADAHAAAGDIARAPARVPGDPIGLAGEPGGLALELDTLTADGPRPPGAADVPTAGRRVHPGRRPQRRFLAIALAGALLAAAVAVSLAFTLPGTPRVPSHSPSRAGAQTGTAPQLSGQLTGTLTEPGSSQGVSSVAFGPGTTLAVGDGNGTVHLWDTTTSKITATYSAAAAVYSVAFGPGGTTLAAGCGNGSTYLWDTTTGQLTATLHDPDGEGVTSVAFAPGGTTLAVGDNNGSAYLWNTTTGQLTATLHNPGSNGVYSVAFGPGGTTLAGVVHGDIYLWDTTTGKIIATFAGPGSTLLGAVAFEPGGTTLAASDGGASIYLWDTTTGQLTATLTGPGGGDSNAATVAFGPGGTTLAASDGGSSIYLWDTTTGRPTATLTDPGSQGVESVAFGPGGSTLAVGDDNGRTYLWRLTR
jgi:WD40 repeat protein